MAAGDFKPFPDQTPVQLRWFKLRYTEKDTAGPFTVNGQYSQNDDKKEPLIEMMFNHTPLKGNDKYLSLSPAEERKLVVTLSAFLIHECIHHLQHAQNQRPWTKYRATTALLGPEDRKQLIEYFRRPGDKDWDPREATRNARRFIYMSNQDEVEAEAFTLAYAHQQFPKQKVVPLMVETLMQWDESRALIRKLHPLWEAVAEKQGLAFPANSRPYEHTKAFCVAQGI